ncbi:HTTM domain-containing protein [Streptomyces melanogenes]|uniref:HTTM domain-containing protein n=1 Tax=Streptomyces melanogenes TaxID=67326 RepID=A0ABZ1XS32_9ACTN|nr:HTTM domain-containing protein [Streptomyces melanogenes]
MKPQPAGGRALDRVLGRACDARVWAHQSAAVRIGMAGVWLLLLVHEFWRRERIWGPDAPWSWRLAEHSLDRSHAFSVLRWSSGELWFEVFYVLSAAVAVALLLGWRTRTASLLFLISVLSLDHRNENVLNAGDTIFRITAVYLVFTRCAQVWSLDARRRGRAPDTGDDRTGVVLWAACGLVLAWATLLALLTGGWALLLWGCWAGQAVWRGVRGRPGVRRTLELIGHLLHNGAVAMMMIQLCLLYGSAGWYKIQGAPWQDGTAVYWSAGLDWLEPYPALSHALTSHALTVLALTYGTVLVQVAFPFSLLDRRVKNVLLALLFAEHIGIGLLLGLPYFSLSMIVADLVFLPTGFLVAAGERVAGLRRLIGDRRPAPDARGAEAGLAARSEERSEEGEGVTPSWRASW